MLQVLEKNDYSLSVDWCFKTLMAYLNPFSHYSSFFFKKMVIYGSPVSYKIAVESVTFAVRETDVSRHNGGTSGAPLKPPETIVFSNAPGSRGERLRSQRRLVFQNPNDLFKPFFSFCIFLHSLFKFFLRENGNKCCRF